MSFLSGKKVLILGVASKLSIASGIAAAMHKNGAELAFTYQSEKLKDRVMGFAEGWGSDKVYPCDVTNDNQIDKLFERISDQWEGLDAIVHCLAFAPAHELNGNYVDVTTREGFLTAHEISSYSLVALAQKGRELMTGRNGSLLTLSYLGALRSLPNYNVMGLAKASLEANTRFLAASMGKDNIRVNAISAGPIKTLAASGVKNFRKMLTQHSARAPLGRTVTTEEVGNAAAFLCSDYASGITGEITYVDAGFNTAAMPLVDLE